MPHSGVIPVGPPVRWWWWGLGGGGPHLGFWELSFPSLQGTRLRRSSSTCLRPRRLPRALPEITRLCKQRETPARHPPMPGGDTPIPDGERGSLIQVSILPQR